MKHILLVEDEHWLAELYQDALKTLQGVKVDHAATAAEALDQLDQKLPDLIILDMFLPDHNGIEFLHELASYHDCSQLPVIILSAVHEASFEMPKERWGHYGVVGYLYKPTTKPADLLHVVKTHFATMHVA